MAIPEEMCFLDRAACETGESGAQEEYERAIAPIGV